MQAKTTEKIVRFTSEVVPRWTGTGEQTAQAQSNLDDDGTHPVLNL